MEIKKILIDGVEREFVTSLGDDEIETNNVSMIDEPTIKLDKVMAEVNSIIGSENENG